MAETGWTKGPWAVRPDDSNDIGQPIIPISNAGNNLIVCEVLWSEDGEGNMAIEASDRANARLIAAAPTMAEALINILEKIEGGVVCIDDDVIDFARTALALARGQEQEKK